jgi:lipoprotein-anchoring transpeptidase ErfK/SrfK
MNHVPRLVPRSPGFGRGISAFTGALFSTLAAGCVLAGPAPAAAGPVPAVQPLAVLLHDHAARTAPSVRARRIESVPDRRPLTRVHTVLPVLGRAISADGSAWLQVALPGRPSGHVGWIPAARTRRTSTGWRLAVDLSTRRVTVYNEGRVLRRFRAVVGKPSTPTPRGRFFIEEAVALSARDAGGPYALATSARSQVLQEFDGGPGQIALHGTENLAGALGTAASHGCIRLSPRAITWLARRIGSGTPLTVTR